MDPQVRYCTTIDGLSVGVDRQGRDRHRHGAAAHPLRDGVAARADAAMVRALRRPSPDPLRVYAVKSTST